MKLAIIADFHGNYQGLQAVLSDIESEKPEKVICAGDMICPYPDSPKVWETLKELNIPMIRGNQEDYVLACFPPNMSALVSSAVRFKPVRYTAKLFSPADLSEMAALPLNIEIEGPNGDDVLVCHASPFNTQRSISDEVNEEMAEDLRKVLAKTIIAAHYHRQWKGEWEDKTRALVGSGGIPLQGKGDRVQYSILEHMNGGWNLIHKEILYDHQAAIKAVVDSDFLTAARPMSWLMFDELVTQIDRLFYFLTEHCPNPLPDDADEDTWEKLVVEYLKELNRWGYVSQYI